MLKKCSSCKVYCISPACWNCGSKRFVSHKPPKYSVEDKYAEYRRRAKANTQDI